jgi:bifunctional pyridoxal-dependent enzyme with beta-cystathionase and maltose regulon repressor activities
MGNSFEDLDLDLDRLRRRRSEKRRLHPPDVLPAFIAEMDYDLAEPVLAALRSAIEASDCGYAKPLGLGEAFARFAEVFLRRGRVALGRGLDFGAPGDGFVRVTIGTSSALLAGIVDRMAAAVAG